MNSVLLLINISEAKYGCYYHLSLKIRFCQSDKEFKGQADEGA